MFWLNNAESMPGKFAFFQSFFGPSFGLWQSLLGPVLLDKGNRGSASEIGQDDVLVIF